LFVVDCVGVLLLRCFASLSLVGVGSVANDSDDDIFCIFSPEVDKIEKGREEGNKEVPRDGNDGKEDVPKKVKDGKDEFKDHFNFNREAQSVE